MPYQATNPFVGLTLSEGWSFLQQIPRHVDDNNCISNQYSLDHNHVEQHRILIISVILTQPFILSG